MIEASSCVEDKYCAQLVFEPPSDIRNSFIVVRREKPAMTITSPVLHAHL